MSGEYDASQGTRFTREDADAAVGKRARLCLTGTIIEAGESDSGPWVRFHVDERWGFGDCAYVLDLDALEVEEVVSDG